MFETMPGDAAMDADLCVIVARNPLPVFVGPASILAETRTAPRFLALRRTGQPHPDERVLTLQVKAERERSVLRRAKQMAATPVSS